MTEIAAVEPSMIERVALVIEQALADFANGKIDTALAARSAIEAMRTPTTGMLAQTLVRTTHTSADVKLANATLKSMHEDDLRAFEAAADLARDWHSMIDAALAIENGRHTEQPLGREGENV